MIDVLSFKVLHSLFSLYTILYTLQSAIDVQWQCSQAKAKNTEGWERVDS